jgi:hypothetical protein
MAMGMNWDPMEFLPHPSSSSIIIHHPSSSIPHGQLMAVDSLWLWPEAQSFKKRRGERLRW